MGAADKKVQAVEDFDAKVVGPLLEGLCEFDDWRLLLMPDHATPCALKTHTPDPVPFVIVSAADLKTPRAPRGYNERSAAATGVVVEQAHQLLPEYLLKA